MATIKLTDELVNEVKLLADEQGRSPHRVMEEEKVWLQSGIDALKNAETNGYAYTAEEMSNELDELKESLRNK